MTMFSKEFSSDGNQVSRLKMWTLKSKLCPENIEPQMAKRDQNGDLVSNPEALRKLYVNTYKDRLQHRIVRPGYENLELLKTFLFNLRLSYSKTVKSQPWSKGQLVKV